MEQKTAVCFVHYLDDYLWGHQKKSMCHFAYRTIQDMAQDIGLTLSPDKLAPPTQRLDFLSLTIDTKLMAVATPHDKVTQISKELNTIIQQKKTTVCQL